ncbi:prepilin peptidase [Levilactobacillus zymae]|uniref:prepilin peptidase n=1 Tax=Levilactobacillus zymae TaxID=267363 RepID=UPI0028B5B592|nr:prepilin peptidase [Levilactobacillus zymae]MDT6981074.1 prepilin peptidase [Levilactobacillus zymae]
MLQFLLFVYGSCLGSFLCAAASRYATHDSLLFPASHCDWCLTPLAYWQMVPGISYWWLRGRCAYCQFPIPPETIVTEFGCGLLLATWHHPLDTFMIGWLLLWIYAALCDLRTQTFPAWVGAASFIFVPHAPTFTTISLLLLAYGAIRLIWPRWPHPWLGDGDLEFISSYWIAWGSLATSRWLSTACLLAWLVHPPRLHQPFPFVPALVASAWLWWVLLA